jgi:uncharacterized protein
MTLDTVRAAVRWAYDSGLASPDLTVVWHAGEPLVLPPSWYRAAFAACAEVAPAGMTLRHAFQTNATLLDDGWCALILEHHVNVGVSLDGPAWLHDLFRPDRRHRGTHARAMRGVHALQRNGVPFHAICVVTEKALDSADAIMDFFETAGVAEIGFNVDEQEGARAGSSLVGRDLRSRFERFMRRVTTRAEQRGRPGVREVRNVFSALLDPDFNTATGNSENEPFRILTVLHDGRLSTFSPELAGLQHPRFGELTFGNVRTDSLQAVLASARFRRVSAEIAAGVASCRAACPYFRLCRGGAPANKLAELRTFAGTETQHCRLAHQTVADVVLSRVRAALRLERDHAPGAEVWLQVPGVSSHADHSYDFPTIARGSHAIPLKGNEFERT